MPLAFLEFYLNTLRQQLIFIFMRQNLAQLQVDWPRLMEMELINRDQALNCSSPDKKNTLQVREKMAK